MSNSAFFNLFWVTTQFEWAECGNTYILCQYKYFNMNYINCLWNTGLTQSMVALHASLYGTLT